MNGSTSGHQAASGGAPQRALRTTAHLWVPTTIGRAALLLALALDRPEGHPDNCCATARQLGVHRDTVRAHRDELVRRGLVVVVGGYLVGTPAGHQLLRLSSPLPRVLLQGRGARPSLPILLACAVVYAESQGWRPELRYVRTDAQRAELAGVVAATVRAARKLLASRRLVAVEHVQLKWASLRRVVRIDGSRATHGGPMCTDRADRLADLARRGRAALRGGAELVARGGAEQVATTMQSPRGTLPMQGAAAPAQADGCQVAALRDGFQQEQAGTVALPQPKERQRRASRASSSAEVLRELLPVLPAAKADRAAQAAASSGKARDELQRFAADGDALRRLLSLSATPATEQLLAMAGVYNLAPKKRAGFALQVGQVLPPAHVLALFCDVAISGARNVGAVLLKRLQRVIGGDGQVRTHCRASWPLERLLDAVAGGTRANAVAGGAASPTATTQPSNHERLRQVAVRAAAEAVHAGSWHQVDQLVQRHGLDSAELARVAGIDAHDLVRQLDELAAQRLAVFQAGRATA